MEKHSLIALIVILLSNLSPPVAVFLPQFCVPVNSSFHWWTLQRNSKGTSKVLQWYFKSTSKEGQPDLLYLENAVIGENAPSVSLVSVFPVIGNM